MNPKTTGVLALVALALGAFVYLYEIGGDPERKAAKDDANRIFTGLDSADVTAVELTTQEGVAARFEKRDEAWRVTRPVEAPADATALDAITHALTHLPREGDVKVPRALAEYGLAETAREIRFEVTEAGGTEKKGLRIGRATPVGGHLYVARDGDEEVAFVESYRVNAFNRKLADLRERRIFGFEVGSVTRLAVNWSSSAGPERVELARGSDGLWAMTSPVDANADEETVREVLSNLSFLRAQSFVDARTEALDEALARPLIKIEWQLDSGSGGLAARIAAGDSDDSLFVDAGAASGAAYRIAAERLEDFPRTINAYRFKQLASFELAAARRIEFELSGSKMGAVSDTEPIRVGAELAEAGWTSADRSLDPDRLSDLIRDLSTLRASEIFADEMGPAELASLGLAPAASIIRVFGKGDASPLAELAFGRQYADRGLFVQRADDPTIYLLSDERAKDLPTSLEAFESALEVAAPPDEDGADAEAEVGNEAGGASSENELQEFEALEGLDSP